MSRILTAEHIRKSFGNHTVLKDINLNVEKGDVVSILGPSGTENYLPPLPELSRTARLRQTHD